MNCVLLFSGDNVNHILEIDRRRSEEQTGRFNVAAIRDNVCILSQCVLVRPGQKCLISRSIMHSASTCDSRSVCHNCRHGYKKNMQSTVVIKHFLEFAPVFA